ncbi:unnamed protein product [Linum trigynum]|uniref:Uncharacterized protein n=1 Tax=Linum trigynum TaxID=586398 RepID=A0AAV2CF74_9ROSI
MAAAASWRPDGGVLVLWRQMAAAASWREMAETESGWRRGGRWRRRRAGGRESEGRRRQQGESRRQQGERAMGVVSPSRESQCKAAEEWQIDYSI